MSCSEGGRKAVLVVPQRRRSVSVHDAFVTDLVQAGSWYLAIVDREGGGCYPTLKGGGARS